MVICPSSTPTLNANQKAGYVSLVDIQWGGSYTVGKFQDKYWMSYLGGNSKGYEAGVLGVGMANSLEIDKGIIWNTLEKPVLLPKDADSPWFENKTIYKSVFIHDKKGKKFIFPFLQK